MFNRAVVWTRRTIWTAKVARRVTYLSMALAFVAPMLLLSLDHHGAERIPTHEHATVDGKTLAHTHGFQLPHVHVEQVSVFGDQPTPQVRAPAALLLILVTSAAIAMVNMPFARLFSVPRGLVRLRGFGLVDQTSIGPLTRPPIATP